jgi:hypothetical protein
MVHRIIIRRRPRVFLPVLPFRRTSTGVSAIMAREMKKKYQLRKRKESMSLSTCSVSDEREVVGRLVSPIYCLGESFARWSLLEAWHQVRKLVYVT